MIIRLFDICFSLLGIILLSPLYFIISLFILVDSKGPVFYIQKRVGKDNHDFSLIKFRTMVTNADKKGLLTVGSSDARITRTGKFLRKYKLDELPQLFNVLAGDMSIVGPRPEVRKYVERYNPEQMVVLSVRPGITDYASIKYFDENELLKQAEDPEKTYINEIMPEKIRINLRYIDDYSVQSYFRIIFLTIGKITGIYSMVE